VGEQRAEGASGGAREVVCPAIFTTGVFQRCGGYTLAAGYSFFSLPPRPSHQTPDRARSLGGWGGPTWRRRVPSPSRRSRRAGQGAQPKAEARGLARGTRGAPGPPQAGDASADRVDGRGERTSRAAEWAGKVTCRGKRPSETQGADDGGTTPAPTPPATVGRRNRSRRWAASVYKTLVTQSDCNSPDLQTLKRHLTWRPSAGRWRRAAARVGVLVAVAVGDSQKSRSKRERSGLIHLCC